MNYPKDRWKKTSTIVIDLDAIRHNIRALRAKIGNSPKVMAVVKADAYGHGSAEVAAALRDVVDWFAVNDIEEGVELRKADVDLPVLVFGVPGADTAELYSAYSLTATVSDLSHFSLLPAGTEYHLNFDTGMGRLGFRMEALNEVQAAMEKHAELICTGYYSHFATSDNPGSAKVNEQLLAFSEIRKAMPDHLPAHLSNTGGAFFYDNIAFDMLRSGIGLYGYPPGETALDHLQPALQWRSFLTQVKSVKKGDTVSYGARWSAPEDGYVGVVPVGYSDGLSRALSGKISFKINEATYPQIGTITMNYCMVFLGGTSIPVGEEVVLVGTPANTLMSWSKILNTIPYEVLTSISPWIPRHYKDSLK